MPSYIQSSPQKNGSVGSVGSARSIGSVVARESALPERVGAPELGFVLDRSGSMDLLKVNALAGFNTLIDEQKKMAIPAKLSLSLFNSRVELVYDAVPIANVPELTNPVYEPEGGTALNDAIGSMIISIGKRVQRSTRVLIAILTDGAENSSRRFSTEDILQMVSYRRLNYDWQFIFIGPASSIDYGLKIGIQRSNIVEFDTDPEGIRLIMDRLSKSVRAYQLGDRKYALKLKN
jgi:uncharacterized protein YegL